METGLEYGLIGAKLGHSFSPEIHAKIGHYPYKLRELSPEGVHQLLEERTFRGLNVTIPYKELVIPLLDEISDRARKIGAVNTIVNRNGRLYGDNTDYSGAAALIRHAGVEKSTDFGHWRHLQDPAGRDGGHGRSEDCTGLPAQRRRALHL